MRAQNTEFELLTQAERAAGFSLVLDDTDDKPDTSTYSVDVPSSRALVPATTANAHGFAGRALSSANSVTTWIKGRVPMIGRPA
ncbi:MAG TPA: hypothetical protein PK264_21265 [Hyphomicrobiaceae bacterium]|nr:hypothetical protein [Hyphomicrobiaceae bacterium]